MKAFRQPQISNSKCLYILCVWVEQSARCFAMQVRIKLQVSILPTSREPGLWFYGSKMPEQADPPLFGKLVDFVCPSCIRHYVQLCFPFFFLFCWMEKFCNITRISQRCHNLISQRCHNLISKCDISVISEWRYKLMSQWYHKLLTFWHFLWYLCDIPVTSDCWLGNIQDSFPGHFATGLLVIQ